MAYWLILMGFTAQSCTSQLPGLQIVWNGLWCIPQCWEAVWGLLGVKELLLLSPCKAAQLVSLDLCLLLNNYVRSPDQEECYDMITVPAANSIPCCRIPTQSHLPPPSPTLKCLLPCPNLPVYHLALVQCSSRVAYVSFSMLAILLGGAGPV